MKKIANIFLFTGIGIFSRYIVIPVIAAWLLPPQSKGAIGIIGADAPTAFMIFLRLFSTLERVLVISSVLFIITGVVLHIVRNLNKK
ncbi:MAG: hypothetical protein IJN65_05865 [Clostridia bacterium]|nr:hypothetical protein [Clostridia bacterium]